MRSTLSTSPYWLALLVASSLMFTFGFACGVPFAAFGAVAALTLSKRDALVVTGGVWAANQAAGFLFLGYPMDANTVAWGAALGVCALASLLAARAIVLRGNALSPLMCSVYAFAAAFAAYEASCYLFAHILGGVENFTLVEQARIFGINACGLALLLALHYAGSALQLTTAKRRHA